MLSDFLGNPGKNKINGTNININLLINNKNIFYFKKYRRTFIFFGRWILYQTAMYAEGLPRNHSVKIIKKNSLAVVIFPDEH
jgi:hypothetical protein